MLTENVAEEIDGPGFLRARLVRALEALWSPGAVMGGWHFEVWFFFLDLLGDFFRCLALLFKAFWLFCSF